MASAPGRGRRFGSVAAAYDEFRLGYPTEVVDLVVEHSRRPVRTAVEIGAGTGKATAVFAAAGIAVTAVEPDPRMLDVLLARRIPGVRALHGTLEDVAPPLVGGPVDLVYAAASLHWTEPTTRWERIVPLLRPGAVTASIAGAPELSDPSQREAVRAAERPVLGETDGAGPDGSPDPTGLRWPGSEMARVPELTDVREHVLARRPVISADRFVGHLSTVSAYLQLVEEERERLLARVRAGLPDRVGLDADVTVHLARRR